MKLFESTIIGHDREKYEISTFIDMINRKGEYEKIGIVVPKTLILYGDESMCKTHLLKEAKALVTDFNVANVHSISESTNEDFDKFIESLPAYENALIALSVIEDSSFDIKPYVKNDDFYVVFSREPMYYEKTALARRIIARNFSTMKPDMVEIYARSMNEETYNDMINIVNYAKIIHIRDLKSEQESLMQSLLEYYDRFDFYDDYVSEFDSDMLHICAVHEASHALVARFYNKEITFITILGFIRNGGSTYLKYYTNDNTVAHAIEWITIYFAGKVGEQVILDTSGLDCSNDIEKIIDICKKMSVNGCLGKDGFHKFRNLYIDYKDENLSTSEYAKNDIAKIVDERYNRAKEIIVLNKIIINKIASQLEASPYKTLDAIQIDNIIQECGGIVYD